MFIRENNLESKKKLRENAIKKLHRHGKKKSYEKKTTSIDNAEQRIRL